MSNVTYVYMEHAEIAAATEAAVLVRKLSGDREFWIPKSTLHEDSISEPHEEGDFICKQWIADERDLPWNDYYET